MKQYFLFFILFPFFTEAQVIQINGTGRTVTLNAPGKPSSVIVNSDSSNEEEPPPELTTESPYNITTSTQLIVRTGGTIGVDCDYTTITDALAGITNATVNNQYVLNVKNGTYNETGTFSGAFGFYVGITLKHYIHIIGESKTGVIIIGPEAALTANETLVDAIHIPASCLIKNVTIQASNCKYPIHADYNSGNYVYNLWIEDCVIDHLGSRGGSKYDIGIGFWKDQQIHIRNTSFNGGGVFVHGSSSCTRDVTKPWHLSIVNSTMVDEFHFIDFIEYAVQTITLTNNTINAAFINASAVVYDANPGNPACNQGFKVFTNFINSGNTVGSVTQNAEATSILGGTMTFD